MLTIGSGTGTGGSGLTRRELLQAGGAGLLGLNLPAVLAAEEAGLVQRPRARSVIFLFLFGGPSQLETFDLKPHAPPRIRGPFRPIASRTPELHLCEHLARCAAVSDRFCVIRTMTHHYNDHSGAAHYIQTGHPWQIPIGGGFNATPDDWPSIGSIVEYQAQRARGGRPGAMPAYVVVPNYLGRLQSYSSKLVRPGEYAGWLGRGYDPLTTAIDKKGPSDNPYFRDCTDDELDFRIQGLVGQEAVSLDRLNRRRSLLEQFDASRRRLDNQPAVSAYDRFQQRALALVTSERIRRALDIRREPDALRDRYGRHLFGQATLLARRLVEAGARFVTVHWDTVDGYSWDSHRSAHYLEKHLIPGLDQALSALLVDLDERGLLSETLVVALGEMGRTPTPNATWGRGHWSRLFPAVVAGAGIRGGTVYGRSDKDAAHPIENPVRPEDLAATIYQALGIDPETRVLNREGRPTPIVDGGRPLSELFG